MGCFAKGCLSLIIAGLVLVAVFVGGTFFVLNRALNAFTSTQPVQIRGTAGNAGGTTSGESEIGYAS